MGVPFRGSSDRLDNRHRQPRKGLNDYDTTNEEWGLSLATSGDLYLATSGDFLMATDTQCSY